MEPEARLPTGLWVSALQRRVEAAGAFFMVLRRGDAERGDVLVSVLGGTRRVQLFGRELQMDGTRPFADLLKEGTEQELTERVGRAVDRDPDVWLVEIDDPEGRHFLTEMVISRADPG